MNDDTTSVLSLLIAWLIWAVVIAYVIDHTVAELFLRVVKVLP